MDIVLTGQLIGFIGVLVSITIFQVNKRKKMLRLSLAATLLYTLHYVLIGAFSGAAMNLVGAARAYTYFEIKPDRKHRGVLVFFILVAIFASVVTWHGYISLLPLLSSISGTIAFWKVKPSSIRRWSLIGPPLWFTYNFMVGSYPGMLIDSIMFVSNLIGEYRLDFHHSKHVRRRLARTV
jgi:hypothetical protein